MAGRFESSEDIAALRRFVGLTQADFTRTIEISVHTLRNWDQGRRRHEASNSPVAREPGSAPCALFPPATMYGQRDQNVPVGPTDRETGVSMKLAIELSDEQANRLREGADRLGIEPEQLALAAVMDLLASEGPDFASAATRVLEKNQELYRRLV